MRAYIAIDFEDNIKNYFDEITYCLKKYCIEGRFTEKHNFHLPIRFIGEVDNLQIDKLNQVIDKAVLKVSLLYKPFNII